MEINNEVVVTNIRMPFISMVIFMVKWAVASLPALMIWLPLGQLLCIFISAVTGMMGWNRKALAPVFLTA